MFHSGFRPMEVSMVAMDRVRNSLKESIELRERMLVSTSLIAAIANIAEVCVEIYMRGGKLLIAGNGGSAADAQHFAAEITCQYKERRKARPALALHTDTSALTAWGNDVSFDDFYARMVEAHGKQGDGLILIATSGNSKNLIRAAKQARVMGIPTLGLLGRDGGRLRREGLCEYEVTVPSGSTPHIQECHIMIIHMICDELDQFFHGQDRTCS